MKKLTNMKPSEIIKTKAMNRWEEYDERWPESRGSTFWMDFLPMAIIEYLDEQHEELVKLSKKPAKIIKEYVEEVRK